MQLMISEVNWLRKNVTKVRAERREKHANPHFRHGQVYHNTRSVADAIERVNFFGSAV